MHSHLIFFYRSLKTGFTKVQILNAYYLFKMQADNVKEEASKMLSAVSLLHKGIVSKELVNYTQLNAGFRQASRDGRSHVASC